MLRAACTSVLLLYMYTAPFIQLPCMRACDSVGVSILNYKARNMHMHWYQEFQVGRASRAVCLTLITMHGLVQDIHVHVHEPCTHVQILHVHVALVCLVFLISQPYQYSLSCLWTLDIHLSGYSVTFHPSIVQMYSYWPCVCASLNVWCL